MSLRRRILRILATTLVILLFAGYFAFSTLLFSPVESDYEFGLATLVPRDVDFFLGKTDLSSDFTEFPNLAIGEAMADHPQGQAFLASPEWQQWKAENDLETALAELETALADLPVSIDPLELFGGEEVLVAGYFRGPELAGADFVALGRTSWMGKLAQSLLSYPGLFLEDQGLSANEEEGVVTLSGGQLTRPLSVARIADVLVLGSSVELVKAAVDLEAAKGQDSFGQSARYADYILGQPNREIEDIEFFVDHDRLMANLGLDGNLPDAGSQDFTPAFLARIGQTKVFKELEGVISFVGGLAIDLHAEISSEKLTSAQKRFYRQSGFNRDRIREVASTAPGNTGVLAYLQADVGDVLTMVLESTEPAMQDNFHDLVRSVWSYSDGTGLIDDIDGGLKDRLALVMRPMDYPDEGLQGPPHDDRATFAWAVVGWVQDRKVFEEFRSKVTSNQGRFGIRGRESGESGVYKNEVQGGLVVYEYWSQFVPGTGHLASVVSDDVFILGNHHSLVADVLLTGLGNGSNLSESPVFDSLVQLGLDSPNAMLWIDPEPLEETLLSMSTEAAWAAVPSIDWARENPRLEKIVLKQHFSGRTKDSLDLDEVRRFDELFEAEQELLQSTYESQNVGGLAKEYARKVDYLQAARGIMLQLALDPKRVDLSFRAMIPSGGQ